MLSSRYWCKQWSQDSAICKKHLGDPSVLSAVSAPLFFFMCGFQKLSLGREKKLSSVRLFLYSYLERTCPFCTHQKFEYTGPLARSGFLASCGHNFCRKNCVWSKKKDLLWLNNIYFTVQLHCTAFNRCIVPSYRYQQKFEYTVRSGIWFKENHNCRKIQYLFNGTLFEIFTIIAYRLISLL